MDTFQPDSNVSRPPKRRWRRHTDEFKAQVVELARRGHGSMAAVALANGLNANMLRRWVRESEMAEAPVPAMGTQAITSASAFVPVTLPQAGDLAPAPPEPSTAASLSGVVTVDIRRGATVITASLPMDERSAAWLREVLG